MSIDTLGTSVKENALQRAVLLYDTEQSEFQLYKNVRHILKRTFQERPPSWFRSVCLVGISRNERMSLILESMDRFYYEYGGIHMVVIDGFDEEGWPHYIATGVEAPSVMKDQEQLLKECIVRYFEL